MISSFKFQISKAVQNIKTLLFIALLSLANAQNVQQRFAIEPSDKTAIVGDTVILPCRVVNKVGTLQWTREGFGLGTDRQLSGFPRYQMIGTDEEGDFSLQITNVQLEDDATFQCQVGAMDGVKGIRSRNAQFTVFVPPEPPIIVHLGRVLSSGSGPGDVIRTTAGLQVELTCEAHAGKPPAELTWLDGDLNPVNEGIESMTEPMSDGKRSNSIVKWTFLAGKEMNGRRMTCRSENAALKSPQNTTIKLEVKFPPDVKLVIESHQRQDQSIMIGDDVHFRCDAYANPNQVIYKWFKNGELIQGDHTTKLVFHKVTKDMNDAMISCEATNSVGSTRTNHQLKVNYAPEFISPTDQVVGTELGSDVTLICAVAGNPPPKITWLYKGSPNVLNNGKDLVIKNVNIEKVGKYICRASVKGFPEIQSSIYLYIKGPPKIRAPYVQYGIEGEPSSIVCLVESIPAPTKIIWQHNYENIDIDNSKGYEIIEEPVPGESTIRSMIVIHKSKMSDFGVYNCSVWNQFGFDSRIITLVQETSFTSLAMTVGIIISCIIIMVGITIISILCIKRRNPLDGSESYQSDLKKGSSISSTIKNNNSLHSHAMDTGSSGADSDIKVEIRTASSLSQQWDDNGLGVDGVGVHQNDLNNITANEIAQVVENIYSYTNNLDQIYSKEFHNNNGFIPNYLSPHHQHAQIINNDNHNQFVESPYGIVIDPRYRAGYANPYLKTSTLTMANSNQLSNQMSGQLSAGAYGVSSCNQRLINNNSNNNNQGTTGQQVQVKSPGNSHSLATHV